jgi:hypothetical protein
MKKASIKSKVSPGQDDLETEFYNTRRVKVSEKQLPIAKLQENKENSSDEELIPIKLASTSSRKVLGENNYEPKRINEKAESLSLKKETQKKSTDLNKSEDKAGKGFADVLDCKYTPEKIIFREKEEAEILKFIST